MNKFEELRKSKGLTQQEAADMLGVKQYSISKWETGKSLPRAGMLPFIANFYGCTVDDLLKNRVTTHS